MESHEEIAKRHLGYDTLKIEDDEFKLLSVGSEHIPLSYKISKALDKIRDETKSLPKEKQGSAFMYRISEDTMKDITTLAEKTFEISYPEWSEDIRKRFIASNFMQIMNVIIPLNQLGAHKIVDSKLIEKVKRLQEKSDDKGTNTEKEAGKV